MDPNKKAFIVHAATFILDWNKKVFVIYATIFISIHLTTGNSDYLVKL